MQNSLINITEQEYFVALDMRYATMNNFIQKQLYNNALCRLRYDAAIKLKKAAVLSQQCGYVLKIWDAYRPLKVQQQMYDESLDKNYVSNPATGICSHVRGVAVDVTLLDAKSKLPIDMGTDFDDFSAAAHHNSELVNCDVQKNRAMLSGIMHIAGFNCLDIEWWHYQLPNALDYPIIMDE